MGGIGRLSVRTCLGTVRAGVLPRAGVALHDVRQRILTLRKRPDHSSFFLGRPNFQENWTMISCFCAVRSAGCFLASRRQRLRNLRDRQ